MPFHFYLETIPIKNASFALTCIEANPIEVVVSVVIFAISF